MRIIVIQRHQKNINGIKKCVEALDKDRAKQMLFTTSVAEVLKVVKILNKNEPLIVVSGQVFGIIQRGTQLAETVKSIHPKTIFFIYSTNPEKNRFVDGVIPKKIENLVSGDHTLLAKILSYEKISSLTDLKDAFPQIEFC